VWSDIPKAPIHGAGGGYEVPGDAARWPEGVGYRPYDDHHWPIGDVEMAVVTPFLLRDRMGYQPGSGEHPDYPGGVADEYGRTDFLTTAPTRAGNNYWWVFTPDTEPPFAFFRYNPAGVDVAYHRCFLALDDEGLVVPVAMSGYEQLVTSGFFFVDREQGGGCLFGLLPLIQPPWSWHVWNSVREAGIPS